jgi:L-fucose isomerase-like protein
MLKAGARMKRTRCVVIAGNERKETALADTGITLQYVPAETFINTYNSMAVNDDIIAMAEEYINQAERIDDADRNDVINGIKSYLVAGKIMESEKADAISMDCLGALGNKDISLPCISWSRMNDDGIPAACEADTGAIASQVMVQYLFDRPGFQQDPVADTSDDTIIGAHCSCPTRLNGFNEPAEPFRLMHHHGNRDAVPRTSWKIGQRVTSVDVLPGNDSDLKRSEMLISSGSVVDNMSVPPSGGCVVSVKVKFDRGHEVLSFPGFHQLFFYGDYVNELEDFCQLFNFKAKIV